MHRIFALPLISLLALMPLHLSAQVVFPNHMQELTVSPLISGGFGENIENIGDLDGDGFEDYAVAAPNYVTTAGAVGRVNVYSGRTAALLQSMDGLQPAADFGVAIQGVGDVDGDGTPDICIGAPKYDDPMIGNNIGRIACFSGATGSEIWATLGSPAGGGSLGISLAVAGGTNGSALYIIAGEPEYTGTLPKQGRVSYYFAATGSYVSSEIGSFAFGGMGRTLAGRAGVATYYAGANSGRVWQLNGPGSMAPPFVVDVPSPGNSVAPSLALITSGPGNLLGLAIGRRFDDDNGLINNGRIRFLTGGQPAVTLFSGSMTGETVGGKVAAMRDLNGDGAEEIGFTSVGGPGTSFNDIRFRVITTTGSLIEDLTFAGSAGSDFDSLADTTGDGRGEILQGVSNGVSLLFLGLLHGKGHGLQNIVTHPAGYYQFIFDVDLGPVNAGQTYVQLYSFSGLYPGFVYNTGSPVVPLNPDGTTQIALSLVGTAFYPDAVGILDAAGMAQTNAFMDFATAALFTGQAVASVVIVFDFVNQAVVATSNPLVTIMP